MFTLITYWSILTETLLICLLGAAVGIKCFVDIVDYRLPQLLLFSINVRMRNKTSRRAFLKVCKTFCARINKHEKHQLQH